MSVEVRIPTLLLPLTGGEPVVSAEGDSIEAVLRDLDVRHPGLVDRLIDDSGLRRHVNVYLNGTDVRFDSGLATRVDPGASITILPSAP